MDNILFKETQYFAGAVMYTGIFLLAIFAVIYKFRRSRNQQPQPMFTRALSVVVIVIVVCIVPIFLSLKLETVYYPKHIDHRFSSIFSSAYDTVSLDSVIQVRVLTYDPNDYGGWGVKGNGDVSVYNALGNKGVMFTFRSGKKLLIGTQQPDTAYARLKNYYPFK